MARATIEEIDQIVAGETVARRFLQTIERCGSFVALRSMKGDEPGAWNEWTFAEYADLVARATAGFRHYGVEPGDRVMLMMRNRPDFHWLDTATQFLRATAVSIYNSSSPEEIAYLAGHAEAKLIVVEDIGFLERVLKVHDELPHLQHVFVIDDGHGLAGLHHERTHVHVPRAEGLASEERPMLAPLAAVRGSLFPRDNARLHQRRLVGRITPGLRIS